MKKSKRQATSGFSSGKQVGILILLLLLILSMILVFISV